MGDPVRIEVAFGRLPWWRRLGRKLLRKPEHDLGPAEWVDVTDRVVGEPTITPGRPDA